MTLPRRLAIVAALSISLVWSAHVSAQVLFTGLTAEQEANARAVMPLASATCDSARWRVQRLFRDADNDLRAALEALGFYDISIAKSLRWEDACWAATFDVEVGEPVRIRRVSVVVEGEAGDDPEFQARIQTERPIPGEILNHRRYEKYKSSLIGTAISRGYFDAAFDSNEVIVDRDAGVADISLQLNAGSRYRFGELSFTEGILRNNLLAGYADIQPGEFYDIDAINDLFGSLNGSTYFKSVSISTEPLDTSQKTVPVNVALTPGTRRIYSIGAGFATDTGPKGRLGYANRRRNDKGHQFESKLYASAVESELTASYRWPINDPRNEWFSVVGGVKVEDTETSRSDTYKLGILRSRNVSTSWLETRYLDYAFEQFRVGDQDTSSRLVILGVNWEAAKGRELSRPENGHRLSFDIRGASDALASDTSFAQFRSTAKWIHSLNAKTRVLARANLGVTAQEELSELPASVRFFAGGDRSIRGYDFEALGPVDSSGVVIGGSHLVTGSIEIDRLFKPKWAVAAFIDSGSAFNNTDIELSSSAGIGIRWYSPVGPVKLDIAHPFDDPTEDFRIHISLGPDL